MSIRVQLQQFEGPLDLLLYLIRKEEMDIFNINIVEITQQYFEYIKLMKEFDLEMAGDFIAMASTLIQIKSKMLLPQYGENGEVVENVDPRKELVQKLLEYEKFKEAAKKLYERPLLNRDLWARGIREKIEVTDNDIELEDNALFSLIGSYRKVLKVLNKRIHKVNVKLQSIASRILEMKDQLIVGKQVIMRDLLNLSITDIKEKSRHMLITFLSLLELGKMEFVSIYQTENYGDIYITARQEITEDVVSRAENYDNLNSDQIADQMILKMQRQAEFDLSQSDEVVESSLKSSFDLEGSSLVNMTSDGMSITDGFIDDIQIDEIATDEEIFAAEFEVNSKEEKTLNRTDSSASTISLNETESQGQV